MRWVCPRLRGGLREAASHAVRIARGAHVRGRARRSTATQRGGAAPVQHKRTGGGRGCGRPGPAVRGRSCERRATGRPGREKEGAGSKGWSNRRQRAVKGLVVPGRRLIVAAPQRGAAAPLLHHWCSPPPPTTPMPSQRKDLLTSPRRRRCTADRAAFTFSLLLICGKTRACWRVSQEESSESGWQGRSRAESVGECTANLYA